jgi:hypothetical protein
MTRTMGDVRSRGQNGSGADRLRLRLLTLSGPDVIDDPKLMETSVITWRGRALNETA